RARRGGEGAVIIRARPGVVRRRGRALISNLGVPMQGAGRPSLRTPFVGRAAEAGTVLGELLRVVRDGRPHAALVLGAAGIGKSRFGREIADALVSQAAFEPTQVAATP